MFKNIMLALERIERRQRLILERLEEMETPHPSPAATPSPQGEGLAAGEWVQKGIDNILAYQAGKKKGSEQG